MNISEICEYLDENHITYYNSTNSVSSINFRWDSKHKDQPIGNIPSISFDVKLQQSGNRQRLYFNVVFNYNRDDSKHYYTKYKAHMCDATSDNIKNVVEMTRKISTILEETNITFPQALDYIREIISSSDGIAYSVESRIKY